MEHASGIVLGQQAVDTKSNEIPALRELLAGIDITDAVITADALHTQHATATATWIINHGGHYLLTVKNNQPGLREQLNRLPRATMPSHTTTETSHGRRNTRTLKAVQAPDWITFPAAAQVLQLRRTRRGRRHSEVVYLIYSLPMTQATTSEITTWAQGHWRIESLHWIRDVVFNEDHHQARTGNGPQIMATLRNLAQIHPITSL